MNDYIQKCGFCGSTEIYIPEIGISFGMYGESFNFCKKCITGMTANQFWETIFRQHDYEYPPKLTPVLQSGIDEGLRTDETIYPQCEPIQTTTNCKKRKPPKRNERSKMTNSLRYDIMRRDNFHCIQCGATGKDDILVVDHIIPIAKGGKTVKGNLQTLCQTCNSGKAAK